MTMLQRKFLVIVLLAAAPLHWQETLAAATTSPELQAAQERLTEQPANPDRLQEVHRVALRDGNLEAAVSALHGLLVIAENQPRVHLALGALYMRMGSTTTAEIHLRRARYLAGEDSEISATANAYLTSSEHQLAPKGLSGIFGIGLRYQSNPLLSPESDEILSRGLPFSIPQGRKEQGDTNALIYSRIRHHHELAPQTLLDSDAILYGAFYDKNNELNYGLVEVTSGVRYKGPTTERGQYSFRPHLVLRGTSLDGSTFEKTAGLGLDADFLATAGTAYRATYQFRNQDFEDLDNRSTNSKRSGNEQRLDLRIDHEIANGHVLSLGLFGRTRDAERRYFEMDQYDITLRYSVRLENTLIFGRPPITLAPYAIRRVIEYGGTDPGIDPSRERADREWRLGLDSTIPISETWAIVMNLEYAKVNSNIVNYDSRNNLGMLGVEKSF